MAVQAIDYNHTLSDESLSLFIVESPDGPNSAFDTQSSGSWRFDSIPHAALKRVQPGWERPPNVQHTNVARVFRHIMRVLHAGVPVSNQPEPSTWVLWSSVEWFAGGSLRVREPISEEFFDIVPDELVHSAGARFEARAEARRSRQTGYVDLDLPVNYEGADW